MLSTTLLLGAYSDDEAEQTTTNDLTEEVKEVEDGLMIALEDFEQRFAGEIQNGDVQDTITYEVGNSVAISASIKKETGLINYLTFISVPDRSEMATMQILKGLGSTLLQSIQPLLQMNVAKYCVTLD